MPKPKTKRGKKARKIEKAFLYIKKSKKPVQGPELAKLIEIEESTFYNHYVGPLEKLGIKNDGKGYYFDS